MCYQGGTGEDGDPDFLPNNAISSNTECGSLPGMTACRPIIDEGLLFGATPKQARHQTAIFVETIRDLNISGPVLGEQFTDIGHTAAHEIGHGPTGGEVQDHNEGGIMTAGAPKVIGNATNDSFRPATLHRFRSTEKW